MPTIRLFIQPSKKYCLFYVIFYLNNYSLSFFIIIFREREREFDEKWEQEKGENKIKYWNTIWIVLVYIFVVIITTMYFYKLLHDHCLMWINFEFEWLKCSPYYIYKCHHTRFAQAMRFFFFFFLSSVIIFLLKKILDNFVLNK